MDFGVQEVISLGDKEPLKAPLVLVRCEKCDLVQLRHTVDRDYLFKTYYYRSGATQTMREHLKGVVEDVMKRVKLEKGDLVVDIGANDGTLLSYYPENITTWGFEPANIEKTKDTKGITIWRDFFNPDTFDSDKAKVITAVAMFYDEDNPNRFLRYVKEVLAPDGLFLLQVNYLPDTLKNVAVGDFCHEHLCYYSMNTLGQLLGRNGFDIVSAAKNDINGGSVRIFVVHNTSDSVDIGDSVINRQFADLYQQERDATNPDAFKSFEKCLNEAAWKVKAFVGAAVKSGKVVDILGASTRGATFLQYARIDSSLVRFVIERDPSKAGKTYLGMPIVSEETANQKPADYKLIGPYWFLDEIRKREKEFLEQGRGLIVPLPVPLIITKEGVKPL
jgi:SAM-dependent methyltransferase